MSNFNVTEQDKTLQELQRRFTKDCKILLPEYKLDSIDVFLPAVLPGEGKEVQITFNLVQRYNCV